MPDRFTVSPNYPNPFNPVTTFSYELPNRSDVNLKIYDLSGRLVADISKPEQSPGGHTIRWDASGHPSGVYVYQIRAGSESIRIKCVLLK